MSYDIIKSICIDEKEQKVFITACSNNVFPHTPYREEVPGFTRRLKEEGRESVELEIMKNYENGNFQGGSNKYTKALKTLLYALNEEYDKFNWRTHSAKYGTEEHKQERLIRESKEFYEVMKKALKFKLPKEKWIITKEPYSYNSEKVYAKKCPTCIKWEWTTKKATKFDFEEEARNNIFEAYKDTWKVEKLEYLQ